VCIDPGHGGKDPGCHGETAKEKDVALAVSLKLGAFIEKNYPDVKVVYTRKTDVFIELAERAAIANRNNADLFICIHCNSACVRKKMSNGKYKEVCNEEANGAETYVMGLHKTNGNLDVAKRENDAALLEENYQDKYNMGLNSDEAVIILSAFQNMYLEQSNRFAELCQVQFSTKAGRNDKGVKQAGFLVLWKTSMPSVLIETGFLTNPAEERFLGSDKGQTYMASSIFRAFRTWKAEIEGAAAKFDDAIEKEDAYKPTSEDTAGLRKAVNHTKEQEVVKTNPEKINSPVDTTNTTNNTEQNPATTGVVYRVQVISSDKPLSRSSEKFKGQTDIWSYEMNGAYKYTLGAYTTLAEATKRQNELRKTGFTEAFVVAFNDKKRIPIDEAKKLNGGK
jgi:N-acetylmuramoyl-L-alanine amidase